MSPSPVGVALSLVLGSLGSLAHADVHVVNAAGGGDFLEIQAAVAASSDGDVLLVAQGVYAPVDVAGRALVVIADTGAIVTVLGGIVVRDTAPSQTVVLSGLRAAGAQGGVREGLVVDSTAGPVRVERCAFQGAAGVSYSANSAGGGGVRVVDAADVVIASTIARGGNGAMSFSGFLANAGGHALSVTSSLVALDGSTLEAGDGGPGEFAGCDLGGFAGHGVAAANATVFVSDSTLLGGDGGGDDFFVCNPGGHGLWATGAGSSVTVLDTSASGGTGACGAPSGQPFVSESGAPAPVQLAGSARPFAATTPVRAGTSATLSFTGAPGDVALVAVSLATSLVLVPSFAGVIVLASPLLVGPVVAGTVPGSGTLNLAVPFGAPPPPSESLTWHVQSLHFDTGGAFRLGGAATIVVLAPGF